MVPLAPSEALLLVLLKNTARVSVEVEFCEARKIKRHPGKSNSLNLNLKECLK